MPLVSVRENLWIKMHAGTAEPFSVALPGAVVLAINNFSLRTRRLCGEYGARQYFRID
jgi:hypothetical protein